MIIQCQRTNELSLSGTKKELSIMSEETNNPNHDKQEDVKTNPNAELNEEDLNNVSGGAVDMFRKLRTVGDPFAGPPEIGTAAPPELQG
jgi:hypothetical protein